jgi:pantetheine-phosphate adenylyltransferase
MAYNHPMRRLAIYPGTFDPPTLGHLDVAERASKLFDEVVVAIGINSGKSPLLTVDERLAALRAATHHLPNVRVEGFDGLLADYAQRLGARSIVRGLRAVADFEYEFQIAMVNRKLQPDVDSVFLMTKWDYSYLSSSIVKEVARLGGEYREMVPEAVAPFVESALARLRNETSAKRVSQ